MDTDEKPTYYYDCTCVTDCVAFFLLQDGRGCSLIPAGTTIYNMPFSCYNDDYRQVEEKNGLFFFFGEDSPCPSFYGVPRVDLFARDQMGRFYGTIGGITDLEEERPICRIHLDGSVFRAANSLAALLEATVHPHWDDSLPEETAVVLFPSQEEARKVFPFWDPPSRQ